MKLLFYRVETKRIKVNELDASLFSDVPKTITLNGVTYELKTPAGMSNPAVYHEVADAASVNECAPSPVIAFDSLPADAKASNPFKGLKYHINDGVGESSSASTSSVKYFRGQIADRDAKIQLLESDVERLRGDKIVANGLIANLEGLAAADGEKIRDLESRLETVAASRERSIDDYNKSVAREGRLREEIQRINLRLADAEHERVRLRKQLENQRIELTKQRDKAIAAHENAEYGAGLLANANEVLTRSLDEMAKSLGAKSKECADRTEALNEARIDESRSTQNAERYQRKLYEIDQIIKK